MRFRPAGVAMLALLAWPAAAGAQVATALSDGTFTPANWSLSPNLGTGGSTVTTSTQTSGGNPGAYREVIDVANLNSLALRVQIYGGGPSGGVYTGGPISSIAFSIDYECPDSTNSRLCHPNGQLFGAAVYQNGHYYRADNSSSHATLAPGLGTWTTFTKTGMLATNFFEVMPNGAVSTGSHPDFSGATNTQCGFFTANSTGPLNTNEQHAGYDNWSCTITGKGSLASPTPTPTATASPTAPPATPSPCCPPWNSTTLSNSMVYQSTGGITAPYTLVFQPAAGLNSQMTAYLNYLHTLNPAITSITVHFQLFSDGNGAAYTPGLLGPTGTATWTWPNGTPTTSFFPPGAMSINTWYRVNTTIGLTNGITFFGDACVTNYMDVRIQVALSRGARTLQIRLQNGRVYQRSIRTAGAKTR